MKQLLIKSSGIHFKTNLSSYQPPDSLKNLDSPLRQSDTPLAEVSSPAAHPDEIKTAQKKSGFGDLISVGPEQDLLISFQSLQ